MKKFRPSYLIVLLVLPLAFVLVRAGVTRINLNPQHAVGDKLDELNGVAIYHNGGVNAVEGRNRTVDGYNLGLRYQCVEFVKRYYFERHGHRMPDTYGHARDFFDKQVSDGGLNAKRALLQYTNGSAQPPQADDLLVYAPSFFNRFGHVAIVASVNGSSMEIAQQNPGPFGSSRETYTVNQREGRWYVDESRVLGLLRLRPVEVAPGVEAGAEVPAGVSGVKP